VNLSAGIGICMSASGFEKPIDLLRNAETAMYRAKEKGQAGTAVFNAHMRDRSIARLNLESKLSQAIANQEFVVNYQPIVSVESSSIVGFEALVRWKQTTGSLIAASDFISLAEDTQFIFAIDMIVMQAACRQLKDWQQRFKAAESLWMSVNLSSRHIANRELIGAVQQVLDDSKLAANFLNLEFTEKTLMEENGESIVVLNQLREMGLQLSIDDFGTGYSSLSYLRHFPVNFIKLDRSFTIEGDWEIATLITDLAHKLELKVVAEGVEKQEQMDHLREIQCDFAQGNLFSAEMNPDKAELLLAGEGRLEPA
jgi:EAL domain-containing protein (putative c-di-GMP-specific phosphodiesterase class I)